MGYVKIRMLFVCTLFIWMTLAMQSKASKHNQQFMETKQDLHLLIFRYLNLGEQGIYSSLSNKLPPYLRKLFFQWLTEKLISAVSPVFQNIAKNTTWVNILTSKTLQERAALLKNDIPRLNDTVRILMEMISNKNPEKENIIEMTMNRELIAEIKFNDRSRGSDFIYIYNLQDHTLYPRHKKEDQPRPTWYFKKEITMPFVIHYRIENQDYVDFLAEYEGFRILFKEKYTWLTFLTNATTDERPRLVFTFALDKTLRTITDIHMTYETNTYIYYNMLSQQGKEVKPIEIKHVITSDSLIKANEKK